MRSLVCEGKFLHVHCGNNILNLIVKAGLAKVDATIGKIREGVKYIKNSEVRIEKFAECLSNLGLPCSKKLCQDVPIRWNSTYQMIESALLYQQAYIHYDLVDPDFRHSLFEDEWKKVIEDNLNLLFEEYLIPSTTTSLSTLLPEEHACSSRNQMTEAFEEFDMFQIASESAFGTGGRVIGKCQSSILPANAEAKLYLDGFESDSDEDEIVVDLNLMLINLEWWPCRCSIFVFLELTCCRAINRGSPVDQLAKVGLTPSHIAETIFNILGQTIEALEVMT
ncbi:hypothetical protein KY284_010748 [Solanum tuberosum]|nr:hypothetical protein KY284_010748 [Solanum tuberosum]